MRRGKLNFQWVYRPEHREPECRHSCHSQLPHVLESTLAISSTTLAISSTGWTGAGLGMCDPLRAEASALRCAPLLRVWGEDILYEAFCNYPFPHESQQVISSLKNSARRRRAGRLGIQGNFHTANTISRLFATLLIASLCLEPSLEKKNPIWYILWILL